MPVDGRSQHFAQKIDRVTDANAVVDYEHKEVHAGDAYYITDVYELGAGGVRSLFFTTPNTLKWAHGLWVVESQGQILIEIYEGSTPGETVNGTIRNRNRNYADGNTVLTYSYGTAAGAGGTLIWRWSSGTATPAAGRSPGVLRNTGELVLKQNTVYEIRITSTPATNTVSTYCTWYEHTNVE